MSVALLLTATILDLIPPHLAVILGWHSLSHLKIPKAAHMLNKVGAPAITVRKIFTHIYLNIKLG